MNQFSAYLKSKKKYVRLLVDALTKTYEFASVLGTDVKGKSYSVDRMSTSISPSSIEECGFVARVYANGKYYEYSFNEINEKTVADVCARFEAMVALKNDLPDVQAACIQEEPLVKKFRRKITGTEFTDEEIIARLKEEVNFALGLDERIINARAGIEIAEYSKMYLSAKRDLEQYYAWINPRPFVMTRGEGGMKYAYDGFGGTDTDKCFAELHEKMKKSADLAIELQKAELPTPGTYTVITDPSITGLIAHEAFGHGLEMDQFVKDRAKAVEYMNKPVASKHVTMHDGAKAAVSSASFFFDDEGVLAQDTKTIDKGILIGGLCDSVSASILGCKPTGNGRRESYKRKAYTRMTNTFFEKGRKTLDEMIASVEHGYYIAQTNNGMEDPKNWGIQCTALYGREIKDGKFTGKIISPVVMSGYVIDLLQSVSMVAKDSFDVIGSGSCGKGYKEWVRVSDGGASIKAEVKIG